MMIPSLIDTSGWGLFDVFLRMPLILGIIPAVIGGIASIIASLLGNRKGSSQKALEALQEQLLRKKLDIANLISPAMIKEVLNMTGGAIGALPFGGSSAKDPRNQALYNLLSKYSQGTQKDPTKCQEGYVYQAARGCVPKGKYS